VPSGPSENGSEPSDDFPKGPVDSKQEAAPASGRTGEFADSDANHSVTVTVPVPSDGQLRRATEKLWRETSLARDRFTASSAAELIAEWERIAREPETSPARRWAARELILQASWLTQPFPAIVGHARDLTKGVPSPHADVSSVDASSPWQTASGGDGEQSSTKAIGVGFDGRPFSSASGQTPRGPSDEANPLGSVAVCEKTAQRLVDSWQACRAKIDRTGDFNRLMALANQFVDSLLVNQRTDALQAQISNGEEAVAFASDATTIANWNELVEVAAGAEASRQVSQRTDSDGAEAVRGRTICLQRRQWQEGLQYLTASSDIVLAKNAEAELAWREGDDSVSANTLAERWLSAANRASSREAVSLRLHALDLVRGLPDADAMRESILSQLPAYVAVPIRQ